MGYDLVEPEAKGYDVIESEAKGYDVIEPQFNQSPVEPFSEADSVIRRMQGHAGMPLARTPEELSAQNAAEAPGEWEIFSRFDRPTIGPIPWYEAAWGQFRNSQLGHSLFGPNSVEQEAPLHGPQGVIPMVLSTPIVPFGPGAETTAGKVLIGAFIAKHAASQPQRIAAIVDKFQNGQTSEAWHDVLGDALDTAFAAVGAHALGRAGASAELQLYDNRFSPEAKDRLRVEITRQRQNGMTPEFRALFGGIDPEIAGTTAEKVQSYAQSLGREYNPPAPPEVKTPETPPATTQPEPVATQPEPKGDVKETVPAGEISKVAIPADPFEDPLSVQIQGIQQNISATQKHIAGMESALQELRDPKIIEDTRKMVEYKRAELASNQQTLEQLQAEGQANPHLLAVTPEAWEALQEKGLSRENAWQVLAGNKTAEQAAQEQQEAQDAIDKIRQQASVRPKRKAGNAGGQTAEASGGDSLQRPAQVPTPEGAPQAGAQPVPVEHYRGELQNVTTHANERYSKGNVTPLIKFETGQDAAGKWYYTFGLNSADTGYGTPNSGPFDTQAAAMRAGISDARRWVTNVELRRDNSATNLKGLARIKTALAKVQAQIGTKVPTKAVAPLTAEPKPKRTDAQILGYLTDPEKLTDQERADFVAQYHESDRLYNQLDEQKAKENPTGTYYVVASGEGKSTFQPVHGKPVTLPGFEGIEFFAHRPVGANDGYKISEATTGLV
ncbi:MAG TPA: hypothetical protein VGR76_10540, partial [Candidatus Angelobacter sp.]|nr:hypothetical protein [Candidatus Angelobacter sp.]